jgi:hypothetical protein
MPVSQINSNSLASGVPGYANLPAGSVLQVVQGSTSTLVSTTSTSFVDNGLSLSITPRFSTSRILVLVSQSHLVYRNIGDNIWGRIQIVRNSTNVYTNNQAIGGRAGTAPDGFIVFQSMGCYNYLDSPATTSSTTYKTQMAVSTSANIATMVCQEGSSISTITLVEIAA